MTTARREYIGIAILVGIFLVFFIPAFFISRTEVRDELRRQDITNLKRALEQYNNDHNHYGLLSRDAERCSVTSILLEGVLGERSPLLKEGYIDAIPHDVREHRGHEYHFCATDINEEDKIQGFYLEAWLERPHEDEVEFDEDEMRKFGFRIVNEDRVIKYRVCGGTENQCKRQE